jgi:hypothetical protein
MNDASRVQQHSAGIFFGPDATAPRAQSRSVFEDETGTETDHLLGTSLLPLRYIKGVPTPRIKADAANSFGYCFADPQNE